MAGVTVRQSTPVDVAGIQRVARRGWAAAYGDFLAEGTIDRAMDEWYASERVREQITRGDVAHFVACETGDVSGSVSGERTDPRAVEEQVVGYVGGGIPDTNERERGAVWTFYVDPDWWGEGIGTRLFERELDALRERGASRVTVRVLAANTVGRSFYESQGFEVAETGEDDLFGETRAAVTYARDI
ncbi:GNAT family N-acetyltransferase [Halococcus saccharolyticus]|uniref:N-acetyltransferase GCN5 n=1 Tax=Halococcus saccharolyticus DSM 5350 TaxID=1227455 RepID=M0M9L3_9EURY|nr:GNAT family N-acetyltransferase [Halococcus saccharolyticus]EMA42441.1 N-acetyltransferase GCN5 [Halococcus saccharolyticus DSM 5350]